MEEEIDVQPDLQGHKPGQDVDPAAAFFTALALAAQQTVGGVGFETAATQLSSPLEIVQSGQIIEQPVLPAVSRWNTGAD